MGARTGEEYLKGLRATSREIWLGGEKVDNVVDHPEFTQAAHAMASWYDLQFEHPDELLIPDPETGEQINISHMIPRSKDDLNRRAVGLTRMSELSMGVMGRLPDYMNVTFAGFAGNPSDWRGADQENEQGCANIVEFQKRLRRHDLSLTHTIVHPVTDKVKDNDFQTNKVPLHKVGETKDSIIVRGARLLATLAPYADEQTVYPATPLPPGANEYALAFTVAMDAPGLVFLCRDSGLRPNADPIDAPFSTRFDEQDALCIFDNVEIPKRNFFINGSLEVYNQVMGRSSWWPNIMQQTTIRALTKLEFAYGLLVRMAEAVNDTSERTIEMLGEVLGYIEVTRNAILLSELNASAWESGGVYPEARALHPMRALLPDWFVRVNDIIKTVGSHNLLAAASHGAFENPRINALMNEFQPGANGMSADTRSAVYRLAWDFTGSLLGSRNELYERNYLTSAKTNRMNSHRVHSEANRQRGNELVDKVLADARGL